MPNIYSQAVDELWASATAAGIDQREWGESHSYLTQVAAALDAETPGTEEHQRKMNEFNRYENALRAETLRLRGDSRGAAALAAQSATAGQASDATDLRAPGDGQPLKSKTTTLVLFFLLFGVGVDRFYLGRIPAGLARIALTVVVPIVAFVMLAVGAPTDCIERIDGLYCLDPGNGALLIPGFLILVGSWLGSVAWWIVTLVRLLRNRETDVYGRALRRT